MLHQVGICEVLEDGSRLGAFMVFLNKIASLVGCIVLLWEATSVRERFLKATSVFKWVVCELDRNTRSQEFPRRLIWNDTMSYSVHLIVVLLMWLICVK